MNDCCRISLRIGETAFQEIKSLEDVVLEKLYKNFIKPIQIGYLAVELEGKYKPSWEIPLVNTCPMRDALAEFAKNHSLYHYHFGYPFYERDSDPVYPGKESEGIVHTSFTQDGEGKDETHILYRVDATHPHPFTVPMNLSQNIVDFSLEPVT